MTRKMIFALTGAAMFAAISGCSTPAAPPPPAAAMAPPPQVSAESTEKVGAGSKPGFCTYKDASGKLIEAKCK